MDVVFWVFCVVGESRGGRAVEMLCLGLFSLVEAEGSGRLVVWLLVVVEVDFGFWVSVCFP